MRSLSGLLNKYTHLLNSQKLIKESFCEAVKECVGVELNPSTVKVKEGVVFLNTYSFIKNEILLHKEMICKKIESKVDYKIIAIK